MNDLQKAWAKVLGLEEIEVFQKRLIAGAALAAGLYWYLTKRK